MVLLLIIQISSAKVWRAVKDSNIIKLTRRNGHDCDHE